MLQEMTLKLGKINGDLFNELPIETAQAPYTTLRKIVYWMQFKIYLQSNVYNSKLNNYLYVYFNAQFIANCPIYAVMWIIFNIQI